jgi:predicted N-formylglutamate amidohydrolase
MIESCIAAVPGEEFTSHEVIAGDMSSGLILICDHARNALPPRYGSLGLPPSEFTRHIAFDIGVEAVTRKVAANLGVPAIMSHFSRLLIDPNRGLDDPTLIMKLSDGAIVPGNAEADEAERQVRIERYYAPYHAAIAGMIRSFHDNGIVPALLSIHSFTAHWKGVPRPWHAGILWDDKDARFSDPLIAGLRRDRHLVVADNEPYRGGLAGDTMDKHGTVPGLAHALLEIRQDLIADDDGIEDWARRLCEVLPEIAADPALHSEPVAMESSHE